MVVVNKTAKKQVSIRENVVLIFSTFVGHCAKTYMYVHILHFLILLDPCFFAFYATITFKSYIHIYHQLCNRECYYQLYYVLGNTNFSQVMKSIIIIQSSFTGY